VRTSLAGREVDQVRTLEILADLSVAHLEMKMNEENVKTCRRAPHLLLLLSSYFTTICPLHVSSLTFHNPELRLNERACDLAACERQGKRDSTGAPNAQPATLARWPDRLAGLPLRCPEDLSSCEDLWLWGPLAVRTSAPVRTSGVTVRTSGCGNRAES